MVCEDKDGQEWGTYLSKAGDGLAREIMALAMSKPCVHMVLGQLGKEEHGLMGLALRFLGAPCIIARPRRSGREKEVSFYFLGRGRAGPRLVKSTWGAQSPMG